MGKCKTWKMKKWINEQINKWKNVKTEHGKMEN